MKHKKLFALLTLMCFLFTLMPMATFASDTNTQTQLTLGNNASLTTPSNLRWVDNKGNISWNAVEGAMMYDVVVEHNGSRVGNKQCNSATGATVCSMTIADFINESGAYTFRVAAYEEETMQNGAKSDYVTCPDTYNYTRPSVALTSPSSLQWEGTTPIWIPNNTYETTDYYAMHYYSKDHSNRGIGWHHVGAQQSDGYMKDTTPNLQARLQEYIASLQVQDPSALSIVFSVRAVSKDITKIANSDTICSQDTIGLNDLADQLAAPTDVVWTDKAKGIISWNGSENASRYEIVVNYNDEQIGRYMQGSGNADENGRYSLSVSPSINESGDYTVKVRALGDGTTTADSAYATSDIFQYTRPAKALETPKNTEWIDNFASWAPVEDSYVKNYNVMYFKNNDGCGGYLTSSVALRERDLIQHNDNMFALNSLEKGNYDNYTFMVRAVSKDILTVANSTSSPKSAVLNESAFRGTLQAPTNVKWVKNDDGKYSISFNPVASTVNPRAAYHVKLYYNDTLIFEQDCGYIYNDAYGKNFIDLSGLITEYGTYKVEICANGEDGYSVDSAYASATLNYKRASGGSAGGSSSSNASSTTTESTVMPNGTTVETTKETKSDGTTVETTKTTDANGETNVTVTTTLPNGSSVTNQDETITVEAEPVAASVIKDVQAVAANDDNIDVIGTEENAVHIAASNTTTGSTQHGFAQPMTVSIPVDSDVIASVQDTGNLTLAKVVTNADGSTALRYVGGSYDKATGTFTAKVDQDGDYILVEKNDLVKIELTIGTTNAKENDQSLALDVAPVINAEEGRTELPLRYLGEALGFTIAWDNNVITISDGNVQTAITIGEEIPGFGTPYITNNRTMVSARYISETFGANVIWDPIAEQVIIVK